MAVALPWLSLFALGIIWLWQGGHVWVWAIAAAVLGLLVSVILLFHVLCFPLFDGPIGEFGKSAPDATQHAVVLAAVKDAARR
jgi:hypothetical protein